MPDIDGKCDQSGSKTNAKVSETNSTININGGDKKQNSPEQSALIKLAKEVKKKGGADAEDASMLLEWTEE